MAARDNRKGHEINIRTQKACLFMEESSGSGGGGGGEQHVQNAARSLPGRKDWGPGVGGDTVMQEEGLKYKDRRQRSRWSQETKLTTQSHQLLWMRPPGHLT